MTTNEQYMDEVKELVGRFATPTLLINGETILGFGMNMVRVHTLLQQGGYLEAA